MINIEPARKAKRLRFPAAVFAIMVAAVVVVTAESAARVQRPIQNGSINQTYLWAEESSIGQHKGVDLPGALGTPVSAVADGTVVQIFEETDDNAYGASPFGNFVLVRHNTRHWDRTNNALSFVYSMYLHLQHNSVIPSDGSSVSAGDVIAQTDNTGYSFGSHLHFQVVLNPYEDRQIETLASDAKSRNPELWLTPLSNTGTAIGKVTDSNGNPVQNLVVCGMQKQTAATPPRAPTLSPGPTRTTFSTRISVRLT